MTDDLDLTPEEMRRATRVIENFRLENGEAAYRELVDFAKKAVNTAKADGIPLYVLLEAMQRRPS
jgi:hypothetical protein